MILTINGKDYQIEYTIEASLYGECAEAVMQFMQSLSEGQTEQDIKTMIKSMSDLPQTTLTMFYAGLLEHHGIEGDNSVPNKKAAKGLIKDYFNDHKEDGKDNFYDLMSVLIEQMANDGFFRQMGLEQLVQNQAQAEKVTPIQTKAKGGKR